MEQRLGTVTSAVTAQVRTAVAVPPTPLPAELRYEVSDPYAVVLTLGPSTDWAVTWVFARALLAEGLRRPTGAGDVAVVPGHRHHRHRHRPRSVRVVLRNGAGTALVGLAARDVAAFLRRAFALVPAGAEGDHVDLDGVIIALMGGNI
ncbi:SsgA family sporulation/cell division regulator [Streptomyces longispororuber]|uniref:SsgA family sporulation/cell division regulator n=1 Tax=Streptomyces longispororuber TaxID=68230 RepID=UPI0034113F46